MRDPTQTDISCLNNEVARAVDPTSWFSYICIIEL